MQITQPPTLVLYRLYTGPIFHFRLRNSKNMKLSKRLKDNKRLCSWINVFPLNQRHYRVYKKTVPNRKFDQIRIFQNI